MPRAPSGSTCRPRRPTSPIVRSTVAAAVATAGATVDDVDDLRLAASEACSLLLEYAVADALISMMLLCEGPLVRLRFTAPARVAEPPPTDSLSWVVLSTLVASVASGIEVVSQLNLLRIDIEHRLQIPS